MTVSNRKIKSKYKGHVTVRAKHGEEFGGAIADGSITASKIAPGTIINTTVANNSIDSNNYVNGSIDGVHIADDSIDSNHYVDGSIDGVHIADDSIDSNHYIDGSIDGVHIADNSIGTNHLGVDVIVAEDIANNAITVAELADNAVTAAKISATDTDFCVDTNGRVGIGVSPPLSPLHVIGDARVAGQVIVGPDLRGLIVEKSVGLTGNALAAGDTVDIAVAGSSSFQGFLTVSSVHPQNATVRTQTTFSVFGRSNQSPAAPSFTATIITSVDGTQPMAFALTSTTNGIITFTNNHTNLAAAVTMVYFGSTGY